MCIIIDTNILNEVFNPKNKNHDEFKPVFDWILNGKGSIVYGGTKYLLEIGSKYLNFFKLLNDIGKANLIDSKLIDSKEIDVTQLLVHPNFDDQHLIALLIVSECKLIASNDIRAYPFFRGNIFFSPASKKPKIYSGKRNKSILADKNIAHCCLEKQKTTKAQKIKIILPKN